MLNMLRENTTLEFRQLLREDKIRGMLGTLQFIVLGY
jgi:hypothetical protein